MHLCCADRCFELALGVAENKTTAFGWYEKAASTGHVGAQMDAARFLSEGVHLHRPDKEAAAEWLLKAAQLGNDEAQLQIGMWYAEGTGVPQSLPASYLWLRSQP